jgi:hypothetical protein
LRADPRVPPGEVWVVVRNTVVGRLVEIELEPNDQGTVIERARALLERHAEPDT